MKFIGKKFINYQKLLLEEDSKIKAINFFKFISLILLLKW